MQTVFSRPWTPLFFQSHLDKEVADRDTVGHRGALVGHVEEVRGRGPFARLCFRTSRALERHDGLQVDLPVLGKPYGFAIDHLYLNGPRRSSEVIQAPAGAFVEVGLPEDHPELPAGAAVYCSSSQQVKQRYRHSRPKPGLYRVRQPVDVIVTLLRDRNSAARRSRVEAPSLVLKQALLRLRATSAPSKKRHATPSANGVTPRCHSSRLYWRTHKDCSSPYHDSMPCGAN